MKSQRFRFKIIALLLAGLILSACVYGFRSVSHYGSRWFSYAANPRLASLKKTVTEGSILDRNGMLLASTSDGSRVFASQEKIRTALVHLLGDRLGMIANSVDSFHAGYLYGYSTSLTDAIHHLMRPGEERKGNQLTLTVDAELSGSIPDFFEAHPVSAGKSGAAVVINYQTGEVIAMVSLPSFDPDNVSDDLIAALDHPYWNRVTQALYPPGSTFKIVTSAAALKNLPDILSRSFNCTGSLEVTDSFTVRDFNHSAHGMIRLEQAFMKSCNSVFARLALDLGNDAMRTEAESFGFNQNFLFRDLILYNSRYPSGSQSQDALAASGYGQSALLITPMHLCLISAAIAMDGQMPEPRLLKEVTASSGARVLSFSSAGYGQVCSADIARLISDMMKSVVQGGGSGYHAAVTTLDVRGKTGTSESSDSRGKPINYGWFTGFNAQKDLPFAVCVLVEDIPDGETGGTSAALIAHDIFSWLKIHPDRVVR